MTINLLVNSFDARLKQAKKDSAYAEELLQSLEVKEDLFKNVIKHSDETCMAYRKYMEIQYQAKSIREVLRYSQSRS